MKTAVVTGATGFIGKSITKVLLERHCHVWAVVRNPGKIQDLDNPNLTVVQAGLEEYDQLKDIIPSNKLDVFYHLAWDGGMFADSFKDYHKQLKNAAYTVDALVAAKELGCRKFVMAGTLAELEVKRYMNMDASKLRYSCIYGTAKVAAEMIGKTLSYQLGIPFNTAILANVYGEGDQSNTIQNTLIRALLKGMAPKLVSGDNLYDWIYIDDVVSALLAIGEWGKPDKTYYVGHKKLQTFEELVTRTRDVIAPHVPLRFGEMEGKVEIDYSMIDREALYRDTGFECHANFAESIRKTAEWLKEQ